MAKPKCSDCETRPRAYRGLCNPCIRRWTRSGRELPPKTLIQEPWEQTVADVVRGRTDDECWPWLKGVNEQGYGQCSKTRFDTRAAHRAFYIHFTGEDIVGLELDHLCHNNDPDCLGGPACKHRRCVNPRHLEVVTSEVNLARRKQAVFDARVERERAARTHCSVGHELTTDNVYIHRGKHRCRKCRNECSYRYQARKKARAAEAARAS